MTRKDALAELIAKVEAGKNLDDMFEVPKAVGASGQSDLFIGAYNGSLDAALALHEAVLLLAACATPAPICDREAIEWNKWGTTLVPAECDTPRPIARPTIIPVTHDKDRDRPDRPAPDQPQAPVNPDEPVRPDPRPDTPDKPERPNEPDRPEKPRGNPGNHKPVGNAGENPGKGGHEAGGGDRGMSDNPNKGKPND